MFLVILRSLRGAFRPPLGWSEGFEGLSRASCGSLSVLYPAGRGRAGAGFRFWGSGVPGWVFYLVGGWCFLQVLPESPVHMAMETARIIQAAVIARVAMARGIQLGKPAW